MISDFSLALKFRESFPAAVRGAVAAEGEGGRAGEDCCGEEVDATFSFTGVPSLSDIIGDGEDGGEETGEGVGELEDLEESPVFCCLLGCLFKKKLKTWENGELWNLTE